MDRRYKADDPSTWYVSPLLNLRNWLEEAYEKEGKIFSQLRRPHNNAIKEENPHRTHLIEDLANLTGLPKNTVKHSFEQNMSLENFLPDNGHFRKWEDDMEEDPIDSEPILATHIKVKERIDDQDKYWKKNEFQRKCKYYRFAQYDYGLKRPLPEWNDPCAKDIIMMVDVMAPHNKMLSQEELANCRVIQPQSKLMIRGEMELMQLKEKIMCVCDSVIELEPGKEFQEPEKNKFHSVLYPSAFIFIHDTFYVDLSKENQQDISAPIREYMATKRIFDPVKAVSMQGVKIIDLNLRLGQPYLYMHSGTCEHLLVFHDLSLLHRSDQQDLSKYPLTAYEKLGDAKCAACKTNFATMQVKECDRLPQENMLFCDTCFKEFHFLHGKKLGNFRAYPYIQMNRLGLFE